MAEVRLTKAAMEEVDQLLRVIRTRILTILERLKEWPEVSGAKPLRGELAGHYRMRTGDYRLQFTVEDEAIIVEQIGHRDGFYD
jgi:mRNA interferase RelE/StbE